MPTVRISSLYIREITMIWRGKSFSALHIPFKLTWENKHLPHRWVGCSFSTIFIHIFAWYSSNVRWVFGPVDSSLSFAFKNERKKKRKMKKERKEEERKRRMEARKEWRNKRRKRFERVNKVGKEPYERKKERKMKREIKNKRKEEERKEKMTE
jgi:hypothetical protein